MTEYLTEQEQVEILKNWIKQYSLVILVGVVLAIIAISGWRYWERRQTRILNHASAVYDGMLVARAQNESELSSSQAQKLLTRYKNTTYSQMAALMLARNALSNNNFSEAEKQLNWIIEKGDVSAFRQIARIRLARVYIANKKPEQSLQVLQKIEDKNFTGLIDEVKGDAYLAMNNPTMARNAYKLALSELPNAEVIRPVLQMKYDNLITQ